MATTLVLMAVFVPVSYMPGTLGRLFGEFGVSVAAAVGFSALIALTLTPMMTSKLFVGGIERGRLARWLDGAFQSMTDGYERLVRAARSGELGSQLPKEERLRIRRTMWSLAGGSAAVLAIALAAGAGESANGQVGVGLLGFCAACALLIGNLVWVGFVAEKQVVLYLESIDYSSRPPTKQPEIRTDDVVGSSSSSGGSGNYDYQDRQIMDGLGMDAGEHDHCRAGD